MKALGVDPGIRGGLAIVDVASSGVAVLVGAIDIPVIGTGAGERVDVAAICNWLGRHRPDCAFVERAMAMPRQGASSGFKYGRATGAIEAALVLCKVPLEIVEPVKWKRFWHLPPKVKEASRRRALELFPGAHSLLARKRDHNRAEAALIGAYGLRNSRFVAAPAANAALAAPAMLGNPSC